MAICANCNQEVRPGELYCPHCGAPLVATQKDTARLILDALADIKPLNWGDAELPASATVALQVYGFPLIELVNGPTWVLGRQVDPHDPPVVDLTPYGAAEGGVSRRHARLRRRVNTIVLEDLGSANGTWLGKTRLVAEMPYALYNADEFRLGQLAVRILFKEPPHD